jgi:hypothetical protein
MYILLLSGAMFERQKDMMLFFRYKTQAATRLKLAGLVAIWHIGTLFWDGIGVFLCLKFREPAIAKRQIRWDLPFFLSSRRINGGCHYVWRGKCVG